MRFYLIGLLLLGIVTTDLCAQGQVYPPGTFAIDGIRVSCGALPTVLTSNIPDAAMNDGREILLNPNALGRLPTVLKLFAYAHECGHAFVGPDEVGADCWAIRTGRDQGWFPQPAFELLQQYFAGNPGDLRHPPGPARVKAMIACYQSPNGRLRASGPDDAATEVTDFCSGLKKAIEASPGHFKTIKGGPKSWSSSLQLEKFNCDLAGRRAPMFTCKTKEMEFDEVFSAISACLVGWRARNWNTTNGSADFTRDGIRTSVSLSGSSSGGAFFSVDESPR